MSTPITVIGNLTKDPEIKVFDSGKSVGRCSVAVTERKRTPEGGWEDGNTSFFELVVFNGQGDNLASSLRKGDRVVAHGNVRIREYERKDAEGNVAGKGYVTEILVDEIGPSLRWATVEVTKNPKRSGGNGHVDAVGGEADYFDTF